MAEAFQPHDDGRLVEQGDIFTTVPLMKWKDGEPEEGSPTKRAVVCSHGCVCEDYDRHIEVGWGGSVCQSSGFGAEADAFLDYFLRFQPPYAVPATPDLQ
jgi:hypothetical protein